MPAGPRTRTAPLLLAVALLALAACGSSDDSAEGGASPEKVPFCQVWDEVLLSGDDSRVLVALEDPPPGLEGPAADLIAAEKEGGAGGEDAIITVLKWVEENCNAGDGRRMAVPLASTPGSLRLCHARSGLPELPERDGGVVLYGRGDDPYSGPMLGVMWGEDSHGGDGDTTPVRVRGLPGVAAPITVFQQTVPEGLGTVIAWEEDGRSIGLYGRGWSLDRAGELVAIAEQLERTDGKYRLPEASRPAGLRQVYVGDHRDLALVLGAAEYQLQYQPVPSGDEPAVDSAGSPPPPDGGVVNLAGFVGPPEEFEAFLFLTLGLQRERLGGREVLVGNAWSGDGPAVVTWREPDGLVVRLVGLGIDLATVREMAEATRELTLPEWMALVDGAERCT